jgi:hypothetical protein
VVLNYGPHPFQGVRGATRPRRGVWGAAPAHGVATHISKPNDRRCAGNACKTVHHTLDSGNSSCPATP